MLEIDVENHKFKSLKATELKSENILERLDLQVAIVNSWDLFKNEIGIPAAYLIGQEVKPHTSTQDSIDLLAYNPDDSSLVVIELKRNKNKLQLLQALSYAAMVNNWDSEVLNSKIQRDINPEPEELFDLINGSDINTDVEVILISELFDPEVIITADWLSSVYSVNITAFAISLHVTDNRKFFILDQRYPLKELADTYVKRSKSSKNKRLKGEVTWDDVLPKLKYKFAEKGINLCQKIKSGDASRRRFGRVLTNHDGFNSISFNFREKYINVYLWGNFDDDQAFLQSKFRDKITISTWRDGLSLIVEKESQFDDLVKWLRLE